ncbi:MAG: PAS domain S-box protein [Steroidobacteraceae bacterium]
MRASCEEDLYQSVCEALTRQTPFALATISVAQSDAAHTVRVVAAAGTALGYLEGLSMHWDDSPLGQGPAGRALRSGEVQFNDDLDTDARFNPWRERARAFGLRSSFCLPVRLPGGAVAVLLSVYSEQKSAVSAKQLEQFCLLGDDLGVCLEVLRSRKALQEALEHRERQDRELAVLHRVLENSVAAGVVTDSHNRIAAVNPAFEALFGYRRDQLLGRDPSLLASGRHGAEYFRTMWSELGAHGRWAGEIVNRSSDGREIVCWANISTVHDAEGRVMHYIGSFRDVTEQIQSMEALMREQRFANAIMESMPGIVYFYDRGGRFRRWNRNFLEVSGYSAQEIERMHPLDFFAAGQQQLLKERIETVFERGEESVEAPFRTKSGRTLPYLFTGRRLHYSGQDFLIGVGIDISQRKAAEEALDAQLVRLQSLSRQVLEIQETERNALGRELHDSVAQDIGAVSLNLTIVRSLLGERLEASVAQRLDDSEKLLEDAAQRLREVMLELRPPGLDEFGLLPALGEHAQRVARRAGFKVTVHGTQAQPRLSPTVGIALFRIAQEALNNAVKHAKAKHVEIRLDTGGDSVTLTIRDDGVGFDPAARAARGEGGMGMLTMAERAESIGARCTVQSAQGAGTCVSVTLPWPASAGAR